MDDDFELTAKEQRALKKDAKKQRKNVEAYLQDLKEKEPWQPGADDVIMNALIEKCWPTSLGMLQ